jgi:DNA (cytosine-5)-methyltransferase 1
MINTIDLFAGCGGLTEGFKQSGFYNTIACVEWDKAPYETLLHRMKTKWRYDDAASRILRFDIQRTHELVNGWDDPVYGKSQGLDKLIASKNQNVDLIIGGPPCQAYSIAGRIRDENGMRDDYRNYLFESYLEIVKYYKPRAFIFENVPGMLSACPGGGDEKIINIIRRQFEDAGYLLVENINHAVIDFSEYGVPQKRMRVILFGLRKDVFGGKTNHILNKFYLETLPKHKIYPKKTVHDAIADLPKLYPLEKFIKINGKNYSHSFCNNEIYLNHVGRYNSQREIDTFRLLAHDIESGTNKYVSVAALKELYTQLTGKFSNIHKYYVLRWNEQSNTIPAHLYKDGLRHIHPDYQQARSITVREAARIQTFPDNYLFTTGTNLDYKMIGNAVPPLFSEILAKSLHELLFTK